MADKQQEFISHSSEDWKSKIRDSACLGEGPLWGIRPVFFLHNKGTYRFLWNPLYKAINLIFEGFTTRDLITSKDPHL